jgi:predicted TIM-barrel fold metal-dependent hydrolase
VLFLQLALADGIPQMAANAPRGVLHYLRQLYYDTALSPSPFALAALEQLVDPSHILFGSDFPFAPAPVVGAECRTLDATSQLTKEEIAGVRRGHALRLFPQLA